MDSTGKYIASAGDRQIRVFHNIAGEYIIYFNVEFLTKFYSLGLQALIDDLTEKVHTAKQLALRERMEGQIAEAR